MIRLAGLVLVLSLAACASPPSAPSAVSAASPAVPPAPPATAPAATLPSAQPLQPLTPTPIFAAPTYAGRLSLTIQSDPLQHMTAEFELTGDARQGELKLYGPFGALLAVLQWQPDRALLIEGERRRAVRNIDGLIERVTGAPLPVALIFDWLAGRPVRNDDWAIEPRDGPQAPLRATRLQPLPRIELVLALKRPATP